MGQMQDTLNELESKVVSLGALPDRVTHLSKSVESLKGEEGALHS